MHKNYSTFFENTFLFHGVDQYDIEKLTDKAAVEERSYKKNDIIYSPDAFVEKIGFVFSGECTVARPCSGDNSVPLNTLKTGDSFGIITVFAKHADFPTMVYAKNECTILFIKAEDVLNFVKDSPVVAMNVITFLTERIEFLNDKISAFCGATVEKKLASYIISIVKRRAEKEFDFNKKRSAEALNCGRASLYRAMDSLEQSGCVKFADKKIHILDLSGLERISK